ncbi:MAG: DUF4070 domain-containing protein [Candidatus Krumholzibacteriota bacterium]|nr:DUF4070 domain-containing protein [Candidatus Krumholzibacteriota bacterium]
MRILIVYPETPSTFYGFRHALRFISKRSNGPPLGLITMAAMLPREWDLRLVDMNVTSLRDQDIASADYVFLGGMNVQERSFREVLGRCDRLGVPVVAGGSMVSLEPERFQGIGSLVLGEAEELMPRLVEDLRRGSPAAIYKADGFPDVTATPMPRWDLLDTKAYASMNVQYSRGCPFNCEFCSIAALNGRRTRVKSAAQFVAELECLRSNGWRDDIFVVDDNFIGNRRNLKEEVLPAIIDWSRRNRRPFAFTTEASIDLADDPELVALMVEAGFRSVFVGIESTDDASLAECGKRQNRGRNMLDSVRSLQRAGLRVQAGFIVGFDSDSPKIFRRMFEFIQQSGIVEAMVGLLNAPPQTRLFDRLDREKRLVRSSSGNNTDGSTNFVPRMGYQTLVNGYTALVQKLYSNRRYYDRVRRFLATYEPPARGSSGVPFYKLKPLLKTMWSLGVVERGRFDFWRLFFHTLFRQPRLFPMAMTLAVYGLHFRRIAAGIC